MAGEIFPHGRGRLALGTESPLTKQSFPVLWKNSVGNLSACTCAAGALQPNNPRLFGTNQFVTPTPPANLSGDQRIRKV